MKKGDYLQYPTKFAFKVPEFYNKFNQNIRQGLFWVKIMQPDQPFDFANKKQIYTKPICWTNLPEFLSMSVHVPVEEIESDQKQLLYQSLINSKPVKPEFLKEYEVELDQTAAHLRLCESVPVQIDEI